MVERAKERQDRGVASHPINGGIVSYSSMLDGVDRYEGQINEYLKDNKDKVVKTQDLKLAKNHQPQISEKMNAAVLYDTPLRFGGGK